tara:strand:- start:2186 stop:3004 length:819 start_codon:yes stop_codon:yes gene_type:complete
MFEDRHIKYWFESRLGWKAPNPTYIEVPEELVPENMKYTLFHVPPLRSLDDLDMETVKITSERAYDLFYESKSNGENVNYEEFQTFFKIALLYFEENAETGKKLKEFMEEEKKERIYVFPEMKRYQKKLSSTKKTVLDSFLLHEFFHLEQERINLNSKYPFVSEGAAWVLQHLYLIENFRFDSFGEELSQFCLDGREEIIHSDREKRYTTNYVSGIKAIEYLLKLTPKENIEQEINKFKQIFEYYEYLDELTIANIVDHFIEKSKKLKLDTF